MNENVSFQVFLIIHYRPLVDSLADVILNGDLSVFTPQTDIHSTHKSTVIHTHTHTHTHVMIQHTYAGNHMGTYMQGYLHKHNGASDVHVGGCEITGSCSSSSFTHIKATWCKLPSSFFLSFLFSNNVSRLLVFVLHLPLLISLVSPHIVPIRVPSPRNL